MASAIEVRRSTESTPAGLKTLSTKLVRVNDAGEIQVYVVLTEWRPEHVAELEALGLRVEATVPTRRLIQGWVPSHAVDDIAALDAVKEVKPPAYGMREGAGAVNTPGDAILGGAAARSAFGVSGAGVKVGVISDGVDHLADSVMSNDLPAGVQVLAPGSGDEGTAMLEIVHDLAPGAALAFYGPTTSVDMANGINALAAAGARVVVDDLSFFFEPKFEDGLIAQTVRSFATGGRVYVSSAGNRAQQHYRSGYSPVTGQNFPGSDYPAVHNYLPGSIDIGNTLVVPPLCSLSVILQWNNRFGAAADDFDLFIARSSDFVILDASVQVQTGTQDPLEAAVFTNTTGSPIIVFIAVSEFHLVSPPASLILDYFAILDCSGNTGLQYVMPNESVSGNHALVEALPIAAVNAATPAQAEAYSSQGPGTISFPFPEVRAVPVLTSVDCVPTQAGALGFFPCPFLRHVRGGPSRGGPRRALDRARAHAVHRAASRRAHGDGGGPRPGRLRLHLRVRPRRRLPGAVLRVLGSPRSARPLAQSPQRRARRLPRGGPRRVERGHGDGAGLLLRRPRPARPLDHARMSGRRWRCCSSRTTSPRPSWSVTSRPPRRALRPSSPAG